MTRKKPLLCKDCKLYNDKEKVCSVVVIKEGDKYEITTNPNDRCVWEENGIDVQEIRVWSDGKNGYISTTGDNED